MRLRFGAVLHPRVKFLVVSDCDVKTFYLLPRRNYLFRFSIVKRDQGYLAEVYKGSFQYVNFELLYHFQ
jgi:hypothetical protein